ncbi:response regulator transcription factor [Anaeromicrobium sediminis]|uniref:Stage 0 sporulation protein A homolog n=1 Tax=Anaeromicrobium sediminis TaxID=1478221 RepID=A0A267MHJ0_9FIRM|nr:response regulator transcription factor [Anaeromicrobium sediminis]PAB59044.1 DNA-binding response regulator [Anaeromicrobium sediminis]
MKERILIAEDEDRLRAIIREYLEDEDFEVIEAPDGKEALKHFNYENMDLALIDIMMPEIDGWSICRKIREVSDIPIIIITARSHEDDKLMGFDLGADDYVTKPFSTRVLVARIKTLLKRYKGSILDRKDILSSGALLIDKKAYVAKLNGKDLELTPREYEILLFLLRHKGNVLTREQILDEIWGYDYFGNTRIVDAHIKKLRKKLDTYGSFIKTVLRAGYKYEDH